MGLVLLGLSHNFQVAYLVAGLLAIPAVLLARTVSVAIPLPFTKLRYGHPGTTIALLTWGGLRGGISIALALSLTPELSRDLILYMTYAVHDLCRRRVLHSGARAYDRNPRQTAGTSACRAAHLRRRYRQAPKRACRLMASGTEWRWRDTPVCHVPPLSAALTPIGCR
jgi:hypothetical protein